MRELRTQRTRISYEASPDQDPGEGLVSVAAQVTLWPREPAYRPEGYEHDIPGAGFGETLNPGVQVLVHPDLSGPEALELLDELRAIMARDHEALRAAYDASRWCHDRERPSRRLPQERAVELRAALVKMRASSQS